jgi:hypothetical protein
MKSQMDMQTQSKQIEFKDYLSFKREFTIYNMRNLQDQSNNKRIQHINKFKIKKKEISLSQV